MHTKRGGAETWGMKGPARTQGSPRQAHHPAGGSAWHSGCAGVAR